MILGFRSFLSRWLGKLLSSKGKAGKVARRKQANSPGESKIYIEFAGDGYNLPSCWQILEIVMFEVFRIKRKRGKIGELTNTVQQGSWESFSPYFLQKMQNTNQ